MVVGNADAIQTYWRLKTNIDSGLFEAIQLAAVAALEPDVDAEVATMRALYQARRDLVCETLQRLGIHVHTPRATIYVWAPVPERFLSSLEFCEHVLERSAVVISPGSAYGPSGEGWFRISLTTPEHQLEEALERLGALA
jgi:LL-diaminopimelate aminotransferase